MNRQQLIQQIKEKKSFLCVGLDVELSKLPKHLPQNAQGILQFNKAIIDATRPLCVAYKPNLAFYEALGLEGWEVFYQTVQYIGDQHLIIADAKRGDIGNTSRMYAEAFFQKMNCDAITVAPYMGEDSIKPFLGFEDKWVIILALTSNPGSADFQQCHLKEGEITLFEKVLQTANQWGSPNDTMYVVGATHPELFTTIRKWAPDHFLLVPGVGAQGGDLEAVCRNGMNKEVGLLINASRSIIYASNGVDFAEKATQEAKKMQESMERMLLAWNG